MAFTASDVVPLTQARATLSDLVEQVKAGAEKIITKNGESYVAIIDSQRLDYYHQLERERIHLLLIDDAGKGLDDVAAGKVKDAHNTLTALKRRRAAKAQACQRNPKLIATVVYSNRMGNRDEASGDAWRFIGRGCIQLTGSSNYFHAGKALGVDLIMQPELVATPKYAALTAGWFWDTHKLNQYADNQDYRTMTKKINGGFIGLDDRIKHINHALSVLT